MRSIYTNIKAQITKSYSLSPNNPSGGIHNKPPTNLSSTNKHRKQNLTESPILQHPTRNLLRRLNHRSIQERLRHRHRLLRSQAIEKSYASGFDGYHLSERLDVIVLRVSDICSRAVIMAGKTVSCRELCGWGGIAWVGCRMGLCRLWL